MTEPARSFQHYEVLRRGDGSPWELGRGAMGITYKAFDVNLCCEVALKVVNSALVNHPDARERFVREARAAAALRHRNVASVYHLGNDGEHFFYAMEFIDGETLDALVRRQGPLPVEAVLRVILQVSKALAAADRQRLVHRDIKPANLMIVHEDADEDMTIKVIDFGLARPSTGPESPAQPTLGGFVGTPQYASPEQLEERALDARSDIYSLGITAWCLLTGQPPFSGSLASVCQQQLGNPPPWQLLPPELPGDVRGLLGRMLEKEPGRRPQSARALREEIEACLETLPPDRGTSRWPASGKTRDRAVPGRSPEPRGAGSTGRPPETLGGGRYLLLRLLEETGGTRVYRARDEQLGERAVTVRTLPAQWTRTRRELTALAEEIRLLQAVVHPHLTQIFSLELPGDDQPAFLVEQPLAGFNLRALLAARDGSLPLHEALRLLKPLAAAADHAESRRLEHLDLALHQVRIHFPGADPLANDGESRAWLPLPLEKWPAWSLKVHPYGTGHDGPEHNTWAGDATLVPGLPFAQAREAAATASGLYLRPLARLAYELLGGAPGALAIGAPQVRTVSVSTLNEAGNAVLAQALSGASGFGGCQGFYDALSSADGGERRRPTAASTPASPPGLANRVPSGKVVATKSTPRVATRGSRPPRSTGTMSPVAGSSRGSAAEESAGGPPYPSGEDTDDPWAERLEGSAWERLSMVNGEPARPGRWLLAAVGAALMFVAVFAGVLAWLLHGTAPRQPRRLTDSPARVEETPAPRVESARAVAAASVTPAAPEIPPPPVNPDPPDDGAMMPTVRDVRDPSADPRVTPSKPAAKVLPPSPTPEKLIAVHLDSVPQGVEIRAHGNLLGVTPLDTRLPPGDHQLIAVYHNWPETRKTIHLDAGQARATVTIPLMPPDLVPINVQPETPRNAKAPALSPFFERRARRAAPVRVEPAQPVAPSPEAAAAPIRRPLPLEPFDSGSDKPAHQEEATPAPTASDEDNG